MAMKERRELREGRREKQLSSETIVNSHPTLSDLELTPDESSNAQVLAKIRSTRTTGKILSTATTV
jgi:ABC-type hemin transport system substrate-binding protein